MNYCNKCGKKIKNEKYVCKKCDNFIDNSITYDITFLNDYREKILRKRKIVIYISILICIIINLFFLLVSWESLTFTILASAISCCFMPSIFTNKDIMEFRLLYKKVIVQNIIMECYDNAIYKPTIGLPKERLDKINMLNIGGTFNNKKSVDNETYQYKDTFTGIQYSSSDYIKASYKNIIFEQADVSITKEVSDSDGGTRIITLFDGQWLIFKFDKTFIADFQVYHKDISITTTGNLYRKNRLQKVELEDESFNNIYNIYAENPVNVFYVLTPPIVEKMKTIRSVIRGRLIFCFVNNELHIGLYNHKDFFEHNVYQKIEFDETADLIKKDLSVVMSFIDLLIVNENLFRRG